VKISRPHAHILVTDGCFYGNKGMFLVAPPLELKKLNSSLTYKGASLTLPTPPKGILY
jgi:hypothetical protein